MDAEAALQSIITIQGAFQLLNMLHLTSYNYPPSAIINNNSSFDFAIIGGGTAGCVIARRLAEDKKTRVLLIEAGEDPPIESKYPRFTYYLQNSSVDWNYTAEPKQSKKKCQKSTAFDLVLGKTLGGSSTINYMLYHEGNTYDFDQWAIASNDSSWTGKAVLPFFIKSQRLNNSEINNSKYFGSKGPIIITKDTTPEATEYLEAFKELGYPIVRDSNIKNTIGYTEGMFNLGEGQRQHTAYAYLKRTRKYSNLFVLKNTQAIKIIFDDNKNAVAVEVRAKDNKALTLRASKEIIVCGGAINTPKLLMLSGIGPKKHLKSKGIEVVSDLPVGKNLKNPIWITVIHNLINTKPKTEPDDPHVYPASVIVGFVSLNKSKTQPEYQTINFVNYQSDLIGYSVQSYGFNDQISNAFFAPCKNQKRINRNQMLFSLVTKLHPKSKGEVMLASSNYTDPPKVQTDIYSEAMDLDDHVKYLKDFIRVGRTEFFQKLGAVRLNPMIPACRSLEKGSTDYWKCYAKCVSSQTRYFSGTCAMGSVVDGNLLVYGVNRLRVVDASVMPNTVSGGPLAAVVMLAEKASYMIKKKYNL